MINLTIWEIIEGLSLNYPERTAIISEDGSSISYAELKLIINRISQAMIHLGVSNGEKVGIIGGNSLKWICTFFATLSINAVPVPINSEYGQIELESVIDTIDMRFVFTDTKYKKNPLLKHLIRINSFGRFQTIVFDGTKCPENMYYTWDEFISRSKPIYVEKRILQNPKALYCIQFTSGSTGKPKGVMLTQYAVINNGYYTGNALHLNATDRLCLAVPLFHCFGNVLALLSCLTHMTTIVLVDYFTPKKTMDILDKYNCTVFLGVPTMYNMMIEHNTFEAHSFSSLIKGVVAGAIVTKSLMERIRDRFSIPYLVSGYGMTETSPGCTISDIYCEESIRFSTVGTNFPGVEIRIIDVQTNDDVDDGIIGELLVKGYNVMEGYYGEKSSIIDESGWLHTGDLAYSLKNGYYKIVGRRDELIIRGGENISPIEIEEVICSFEEVIDAKAFSIPDQMYGEEVAVGVINSMWITKEEIINRLKERIAHYKIPKYVFFFSDFPCSASGKVLKPEIREIALKRIMEKGSEFYEIIK